MMTIPPDHRMPLAPLFEDHPHWRHLIDAALEGAFGTAETDDLLNPGIARLVLGYFSFYGGAPSHPAARDLVTRESYPPFQGRWVEFSHSGWQALFRQIHGDSKYKSELLRFDFSSDQLDAARVRTMADRVPSGFRIARLNAADAARAARDIEGALTHTFASAEDFVIRGFGYGATEIQTGRLASAATTYALSRRGVEVEVDTHPDFRRMGLGSAVSAALIAHALNCGLDPHWDAVGEESAGLARTLGYRAMGSYRANWLDPDGY